MGALYVLLKPLAILGLHPDRPALRLGLTLAAVDGIERGRGNLSRLVSRDAGRDLPDKVELVLTPFTWKDRIVALALLSIGIGLWLSV